MVETTVTFASPGEAPIEMVALSHRTITPMSNGDAGFNVDVPFTIPPGGNAGGTVRVDVIGTDERGGTVAVFRELTVTPGNTQRPAGTCTEDGTTLCMGPEGEERRFKVTVAWTDADGNQGLGKIKERFEAGGGWFTFDALTGILDPTGMDLAMRMIGCESPDDPISVAMLANTDIEFTMTVTDTKTNRTREYFNAQGTPPDPDSFVDPEAFPSCQ
jgi:hypothetical protein